MKNTSFLSIADAAAFVGVSTQTLRRWDKSGVLKPDFLSPGGHRKYRQHMLETFSANARGIADQWVSSREPMPLEAKYHCENSGVFQVCLHRFEQELVEELKDENKAALIVAVAGEIGNNAFDHNFGNWPDVSGVFFAYDLKKCQVIIAERGQGILTTLKRVRPQLQTNEQALRTAFTEIVTGRAPEPRGNGLKFVRDVVTHNPLCLFFQSGDVQVEISPEKKDLLIIPAEKDIRGTHVVLEYK
ncbi:MAG: MerR family DNA-binding transcriptional regulator [Patescibacteria group bacterium]